MDFRPTIPEIYLPLLAKIADATDFYLVGGFVRDTLLNIDLTYDEFVALYVLLDKEKKRLPKNVQKLCDSYE